MIYFNLTIRYILGISASLYIIYFLLDIFDKTSHHSEYLPFLFELYIEFPAIILLLIVSAYTFLTRRVFWSLFKIEYCLLFANILIGIICGLVYLLINKS